jgi:hypothetical protein
MTRVREDPRGILSCAPDIGAAMSGLPVRLPIQMGSFAKSRSSELGIARQSYCYRIGSVVLGRGVPVSFRDRPDAVTFGPCEMYPVQTGLGPDYVARLQDLNPYGDAADAIKEGIALDMVGSFNRYHAQFKRHSHWITPPKFLLRANRV